MTDYDVFNGDADGICALIQLRKAEPRKATLLTGVKRDINLLARVEAGANDRITVLDVSMDRNREGLNQALANGAEVFYVDHHFAGDIPQHPGLQAIINEGPTVCTAALVNGYLKAAYLDWAVVGAYGDNLKVVARRMARPLQLSDADLQSLEQLGTYVNYNAYGPTVEDLHLDPCALYHSLYESESALEFVHSSDDYQKLRSGYLQDMAQAGQLTPVHVEDSTAVFLLPDETWALRVRGVFGNNLAITHPDRAHAVITEKATGNYLVSVRAPFNKREGAADLCRQFPSGGGRTAAAGITDLPRDQLEVFIAAFQAAYSN